MWDTQKTHGEPSQYSGEWRATIRGSLDPLKGVRMVDKSKYKCPHCAGQCDKIMTVVWLENEPEGKGYLVFAERTCKVCAASWINQERIITDVTSNIQKH